MIKLLLILFVLSFSVDGCREPLKSEDVNFLIEKDSYWRCDTIHFQMQNKKPDSLDYYISLETLYDQSWDEVLLDVDPSAPDRGTIIKSIGPFQIKQLSINLLKYFDCNPTSIRSNQSASKTYRLVLNEGTKNIYEFKRIYSKSFTVKY